MSRRPPPGRPCEPDLWSYLAGDMPAAAARAVTRHLTECAGCRRTLARIDAWRRAYQRAISAPLPAAVRSRARGRVRDVLAPARVTAATARAASPPPAARRRRR